MSATKTAPSTPRKRATKRVPPLWVSDTGIVNGRRDLRAVYPSARGNDNHVCSAHDDGTVTNCACPGFRSHGHCWHGDAIVDDFWRARWGTESLAALQWRSLELIHWLTLGPDEADENCARLELTALGDLILSRLDDQEAA